MAHATNEELRFFPHSVLALIIANSWPTETEVEYLPFTAPDDVPEHPVQLTGLNRVHERMIEGAFQSYFEKVRPQVEQRFGTTTTQWPDVWNFGRIIRNAMSHGGQINFRNPRAASVNWQNLTYSPADNGKQIMYIDLTPVEVLRLLEDMDAAV